MKFCVNYSEDKNLILKKEQELKDVQPEIEVRLKYTRRLLNLGLTTVARHIDGQISVIRRSS